MGDQRARIVGDSLCKLNNGPEVMSRGNEAILPREPRIEKPLLGSGETRPELGRPLAHSNGPMGLQMAVMVFSPRARSAPN